MTSGDVEIKRRRGILRGGQCREPEAPEAQTRMRRSGVKSLLTGWGLTVA